MQFAPNDIVFALRKPDFKATGTAATEMKKACSAQQRYRYSQEIFARWPNLREASLRLTSLLTRHWPDYRNTGGSLLVNCLERGFNEAEISLGQSRDDLKEQISFVQSIARELASSLSVTLMIKKNGVWSVYEPSINGYLDLILSDPATEELNWYKKPSCLDASEKSTLVCASRIFTPDELRLAGLLD